jgi:hypothetical protein
MTPHERPPGRSDSNGVSKFARRRGASDPDGTIYLYGEHALPHAEPSENARPIKAHGGSMPDLIHCASWSIDRHRVTLLHQQLGLKVRSRGSAALFEFWSLLESNELKIFASLSMFLEEYRIGEYQSPLLLCAQTLVSRPDLLESKEAEPDDDEYWRGTSSPFLGRALGCVDGLPGTFGDEQTGTCGARPQRSQQHGEPIFSPRSRTHRSPPKCLP